MQAWAGQCTQASIEEYLKSGKEPSLNSFEQEFNQIDWNSIDIQLGNKTQAGVPFTAKLTMLSNGSIKTVEGFYECEDEKKSTVTQTSCSGSDNPIDCQCLQDCGNTNNESKNSCTVKSFVVTDENKRKIGTTPSKSFEGTENNKTIAQCNNYLTAEVEKIRKQKKDENQQYADISNTQCSAMQDTLFDFCKDLAGSQNNFIQGKVKGTSTIRRYSDMVNTSCNFQVGNSCDTDAVVTKIKSGVKSILDKLAANDGAAPSGEADGDVNATQVTVSGYLGPRDLANGSSGGNTPSNNATTQEQACDALANKIITQFTENSNMVVQCQAIAFMFKNDAKKEGKESRFTVSKAAKENSATIRGMDPRIGTCEHNGTSTDFDNCKQLINTINGSIVGMKATQMGGQIHQINTQSQINQNLKEDGGKSHGALIDAASGTVQASRDGAIAEESALTLNATLISSFIGAYQTPKKIYNRCMKSAFPSRDEGCEAFNDASIANNLFNNTDVLGGAKAYLAETITKMAVKGAEIAALQKQLEALNTTKENLAKLEAPKGEQNFGDLTMGLCQANPAHPQCQNNQQAIGLPIDGTGLNFGSGFSNVAGANGNFVEATQGQAATNTPSGSDSAMDLGPMAVGASQGGADNSIEGPSGGYKLADNSATTGGGGGASAPGGSGSSGIGGGGGAGGPAGSTALNMGKSGIAYGGSGFKIGGQARGKGGENPFDQLVNKDSNKAGGQLDFRNPASDMGDSTKGLFVRITEGYQKATNAKKLIEYEVK